MSDQLTTAIATDLGITDLPLEDQQKLIETFGAIALKAATLSVIGKLTEDKRDAFGKLVEAGDVRALKEFLDREIPGHEDLVKAAVAEEIKRFKDFQTESAEKKIAS